MNKNRQKIRELNKLSAYLDNALSVRESREFEARLAVDPELREKLDNLRRTKLALSRLTRLKAPHNFTLTPAMVSERSERKPRRQSFQSALRMASALAAILLVVMFGAEFLLGELRQPAMLTAEGPVMEAARAPDETDPQPLIQWGPPGTGGGEVGGMGGDSVAMEALPEEEAAPESESLPEEQPEIPQEEAEEVQPPAAKGGDLILGINADEGGEIIDRSEPAAVQQEPEALPWPEIIRWVQIALAVIAVGGGLALLFLRQRKRE